MFLLTPFLPQQADTLKKAVFETDSGTPSETSKEKQEQSDTTTVKKGKKEKKKKEKKENPETAEKKINKSKSDSLKKAELKKTEVQLQSQKPDTAKIIAPSVLEEKSLFANHLLKASDIKKDKIHLEDRQYWVPSIVLFSLLVVVWARTSHNKRFSRIGKSFFNIREFYQVVREEYSMSNSLAIGMSILFMLTISVFIYQINSFYSLFALSPNAFVFFIKILLAVLLFFLIKLLFVRTLGALFYGKSEQATDFVYNIFLMNNVSGLALIPIIIFMAYFSLIPKPTLILISFGVLACIYLYRILRAFRISIGEGRVSKLYFFVYLCTLEFLPFVVIFKVIMGRF